MPLPGGAVVLKHKKRQEKIAGGQKTTRDQSPHLSPHSSPSHRSSLTPAAAGAAGAGDGEASTGMPRPHSPQPQRRAVAPGDESTGDDQHKQKPNNEFLR